MDKRDYLRLIHTGTARDFVKALRIITDYHLSFKHLDAKIDASLSHKPIKRQNKKPRYYLGPRFFTKLNRMPAVSIEVKESRSHIRKTSYGFRDRITGERVYLRVDPGSIVEFRDSPCGYLIGTRYLVRNINKIMPRRWDKVNGLLNRLLRKEGIIVTADDVDKYRKSNIARCKLAKLLIYNRIKNLKHRNFDRRRKREKALK